MLIDQIIFRMASYADLEMTTKIQTQKIDGMNSERRWLEQDNDLQCVTAIQLSEKIAEYEKYIHSRENALDFQIKGKIARYKRYMQTREQALTTVKSNVIELKPNPSKL